MNAIALPRPASVTRTRAMVRRPGGRSGGQAAVGVELAHEAGDLGHDVVERHLGRHDGEVLGDLAEAQVLRAPARQRGCSVPSPLRA